MHLSENRLSRNPAASLLTFPQLDHFGSAKPRELNMEVLLDPPNYRLFMVFSIGNDMCWICLDIVCFMIS